MKLVMYNGVMECTYCYKSFTAEYSLQRHIRKHHDQNTRLECCAVKFDSEENNQFSNADEENYICDNCGYVCVGEASFYKHLFLHSNQPTENENLNRESRVSGTQYYDLNKSELVNYSAQLSLESVENHKIPYHGIDEISLVTSEKQSSNNTKSQMNNVTPYHGIDQLPVNNMIQNGGIDKLSVNNVMHGDTESNVNNVMRGDTESNMNNGDSVDSLQVINNVPSKPSYSSPDTDVVVVSEAEVGARPTTIVNPNNSFSSSYLENEHSTVEMNDNIQSDFGGSNTKTTDSIYESELALLERIHSVGKDIVSSSNKQSISKYEDNQSKPEINAEGYPSGNKQCVIGTSQTPHISGDSKLSQPKGCTEYDHMDDQKQPTHLSSRGKYKDPPTDNSICDINQLNGVIHHTTDDLNHANVTDYSHNANLPRDMEHTTYGNQPNVIGQITGNDKTYKCDKPVVIDHTINDLKAVEDIVGQTTEIDHATDDPKNTNVNHTTSDLDQQNSNDHTSNKPAYEIEIDIASDGLSDYYDTLHTTYDPNQPNDNNHAINEPDQPIEIEHASNDHAEQPYTDPDQAEPNVNVKNPKHHRGTKRRKLKQMNSSLSEMMVQHDDVPKPKTDQFFSSKQSKGTDGKNHRKEKKHKCHVCDKVFKLSSHLRAHVTLHTGEACSRCKICGKYLSDGSMALHLKRHEGALEKNFKCHICGKSFLTKHYLIIHKRIHSGEKPYECGVCKKRFIRKDSVKVHFCLKATIDAKRSHTEDFNKETPCTYCDICKTHFDSAKSIEAHNRKTHVNEKLSKEINDKKPFKCDICGNKFTSKGNLNCHLVSHRSREDFPFKCSVCYVKFAHKSNLNSHMRTHADVRPFKCDVCEVSFRRGSHLRHHVRIHNGSSFKCPKCVKTFSQPRYLKEHLKRVHSLLLTQDSQLIEYTENMKSKECFKCEICDKELSRRTRLNEHMRIHTGVKAYNCDYCEKGFISTYHLNKHYTQYPEHKIIDTI